jgi:hypothetical protein
MGKHHIDTHQVEQIRTAAQVPAEVAELVGGAAVRVAVHEAAQAPERHTDLPAHNRRTDVVDMLGSRTVVTRFELGGRRTVQGAHGPEVADKPGLREFKIDPSRRDPVVSRDDMKRQLGIDAALAATVVQNPRQPGADPVRFHVLDRGPVGERETSLTPFVENQWDGRVDPRARYVAVTDGFLEGMYAVQMGTTQTQPLEGDSWRSVPADGLKLGRANWEATFGELMPGNGQDHRSPDGMNQSYSRLGTSLYPDGNGLRVVDHSLGGTEVVLGPLQVGNQDSEGAAWLQPQPTADKVPYPIAASYAQPQPPR